MTNFNLIIFYVLIIAFFIVSYKCFSKKSSQEKINLMIGDSPEELEDKTEYYAYFLQFKIPSK